MRLPGELWIRIGVFADCLPELELLTRELHAHKPTRLLLCRALEEQWGSPEELRPLEVRRLWPDLGAYLRDLAQTWEDLVLPRKIPVHRALYTAPGRKHVVYGLKSLKYKVLRRQGRFGLLALIG